METPVDRIKMQTEMLEMMRENPHKMGERIALDGLMYTLVSATVKSPEDRIRIKISIEDYIRNLRKGINEYQNMLDKLDEPVV